MRISFILDRLNLGGAERHTLNLSRALAARGYEVQVIVLFSGGSKQFPVCDFPVSPIFLNAKGILSFGLTRRLKDALNNFRADTVFAVNQSALVAATLARYRGANISQLCCRFSTTIIDSLIGRMKLPFFKWCTSRADALIFVSLLQRDYWEMRGMTSKNVFVIQNGIASDRFLPPSDIIRAQSREKYGFGFNDVSLTLVGRLSPEKNHSWLIETVAKLKLKRPEEFEPLHLFFIGEGPLRSELENLVYARGLDEKVTFAGGMSDIVPALAQADAGILVSNAVETFSHAALELMSTGLPVVLTDIGGASEIIVDGEQGFLVLPEDDAALEAALTGILDPASRSKMGVAARNRVLERFTYDRMVDQYEAIVTGNARL
ncbi:MULTISPECIES: glycosyltransferase family 4 protein [Salipiger]|uniref:glycosyltransferase family 4 protein n=1 Tax=Salipiger TaxID=263377 RepID=UPI0009778E2C|nr:MULTISPECIES: glycosyltransferase family 4 protein [Salipiger]GGA27737.1 hypothetical protein GCM10011326_44810 [Salipiger profundus]